MSKWITPDWPAPAMIRAISTDKTSGNLATHVGDDLERVLQNRQILEQLLDLKKFKKNPPNPPLEKGGSIRWLNQCHTAIALDYDQPMIEVPADACYTTQIETVCAVLTGDCLPVLLCNTQGSWLAAVHGGWRGLLGGVLLKSLQKAPPGIPLMAWLGPAISAQHYEVGPEVREAFLAVDQVYKAAFYPIHLSTKFLLDLYEIARVQLQKKGVAVFGGEYCTYSDERFYSYRRENQTGRQATMIWRVSHANS